MAKSTVAQQRLAAWLIDVVLVLGIGTFFHAVGWIATTAYWLLRDGLFKGQSIGKRLMGLNVIMQPGKARCTFKASLIRNVLWVVPVINVVMGLTGLYYLFTDSAGRHWGDRLADTKVIKA